MVHRQVFSIYVRTSSIDRLRGPEGSGPEFQEKVSPKNSIGDSTELKWK
jgi:hypothetical protein